MVNWRSWPDKKPPVEGDYWVTVQGIGRFVRGFYFDGANWYAAKCDTPMDNEVIAWTEIYYPMAFQGEKNDDVA